MYSRVKPLLHGTSRCSSFLDCVGQICLMLYRNSASNLSISDTEQTNHYVRCNVCMRLATILIVIILILENQSINRMPTVHTHTHPFNRPFPGLPRWAGTRKVKPIWIVLKHETVSGSGINWAICKSAPRSRQITTPAPHHSVFYRPDALLPPNQRRQSTEGNAYSS